MKYNYFLIVLNLILILQAVVTVQQTNDSSETDKLREHQEEASQKQSQGSNFARYNQSCALTGEAGLICDTAKDMVCDSTDRICKCKFPSTESDPSYVYSDNGDKCYEVATKEKIWQCTVNEQCLRSTMGRYSQCHPDNKRCVCHDTDSKLRETKEVNGRCLVKKELGSQCETDIECEQFIENSVCFGTKSGPNVGTCQCRSNFEYDKKFEECLQLGTINSTCKSNIQCNDLKALGLLSVCSDNLRCECWDTNGSSPTGFYKDSGKCHYVRGVNETCNIREECVLGYGSNAICTSHPSYNNQKICQCPLGIPITDYRCSGSEVTVSLFLVAVLAILIKSF